MNAHLSHRSQTVPGNGGSGTFPGPYVVGPGERCQRDRREWWYPGTVTRPRDGSTTAQHREKG